jgi:hypothetical protein
MYLLFLIISFMIYWRNFFSNKKYGVQLVGHVIFIYRSNPEIVINDYYFYIQQLLTRSLGLLQKKSLIFFECQGLKPIKLLLPHTNIFLQIEHTLYKPDSSLPSIGIPGNLFLPNRLEKYQIRIAEFQKLKSADIIFDYSRINLFNIQSSPLLQNYLDKSFCISPALYPLFTGIQGRKGVITLFGNLDNQRRKQFLDDLRRHEIASQNINGVYFGVDQIYRSAKIVINIRQTDSYDTLEELRILPALRSGAIVVSETAPFVEKTAYSKFIIWGSLKELPSLIKEVEGNYQAIHRSIFGDGSDNSQFIKRMKRIEKRNSLSIQRAINKINGI